ncbi:putative amino acid permease YhdG [Gimesia panareensis]|uniref:Putative amino acid permease YhdG n=1 Tax=Gimesia panareensis TaxID=2527978 RepID=A0A518FIQ3_9PLAN|nr:APC family permease [Gimesia panareensis]QDV16228.1 putative amino acid permease YhdG [Gimesia panareensis]
MEQNSDSTQSTVPLKRSISLWKIVLYGVGTMLGAGIYVLISKIAGSAGMYVPLAFLISAIIVSFSAFSYAELSSRLPVSAGEVAYVHAAFNRKSLSVLVGLAVLTTGIVSAATISRGFVGYLNEFVEVNSAAVITVLVLSVGLLAAFGVDAAVGAVVAITFVELTGVLLVIAGGADELVTVPLRFTEFVPPFEVGTWMTILFASFLAFYAYIGFEDMVNMAEEVTDVERTMPRAIVLALAITTTLYILVSLVAVLTLPMEQLIHSQAPFTDIVREHGLVPPWLISAISLVAVLNGVMVQVVMASRILYGMGRQGIAPGLLGNVHPRTQTPLWATGIATVTVLVLALGFPIESLARGTSFVMLCVFTMVNAALIKLKRSPESDDPTLIRYPLFVPVLGAILSVLLLLMECVRHLGWYNGP